MILSGMQIATLQSQNLIMDPLSFFSGINPRREPLHSSARHDLFKSVVERVEHQCELSTAVINLQKLPIEELIPLIQQYADQTGKFFSGYYDKSTNTFHIANCPYTGVGASRTELDQTAFDQSDLDQLVNRTQKTIKADMIDPLLSRRSNESRIIIGLQEGVHSEGPRHQFEELAKPLQNISNEVRSVDVVVIRPRQKLYQEPAVCVNIWDEDEDSAFLKQIQVLDLARKWNDHVILEDIYRFTSYSLKLRQGRRLVFHLPPISPDRSTLETLHRVSQTN
jgi:hypothetical protein